MAKKIYGTTLWGREFLTAIENETDTARLSRGKTYANTGKIYDVELKSRTISAKVTGNYSPFYTTRLSFTQFTKGDIKVILDFIDNNPFVLADIINGKLSKELLDFFYKNEIELFRGFDMSCNCYDYYGSYACKHISALYYVLTNEIDKNPFILLKLRGLDLIKHYNIKDDLKVVYPLELNYTDNINVKLLQEDIQILKLENYSSFILSMLSSFPPFAHIDYKEVLTEFYKKSSKELPLIISPIRDENISKIQRVLQDSNISIEVKDDIQVAKFKISSELLKDKDTLVLFDKYRFRFEDEQLLITPTNLFNLFVSFEDDYGSTGYNYLFYLFRVAYILIENSGFIPAVIEHKNFLQIIYKPLLSVENINTQINILSDAAPIIAQKNSQYLDTKSATNYILSAILTDFVPNLDFMHKQQKVNPPAISHSFFKPTFPTTHNETGISTPILV